MKQSLQRTLREHVWLRWIAVAVSLVAVGGVAIAETTGAPGPLPAPSIEAILERSVLIEERTVWDGLDVDGDTTADFANPTGGEPREHDAYGDGYFGASRDGGHRDHEGVDYVGAPGQAVVAPISGYVTKIGFAYDDSTSLKYVEITNPALSFEARVFYVDPQVRVGDAVALGDVIGKAADLTRRYPRGMTNHVHLEIKDQSGQRVDAAKLITARVETVRREI